MTLTREEILAMEPGDELNALIGQTTGVSPQIKYWATDKNETGIYIDFNYKTDADEWMREQTKLLPEWVEENGIHIERKEIYRPYSESVGEAFRLLEIPHVMDELQIGVYPTSFGCWVARKFMPGGKDCTVQSRSAAESIGKCYLLAVLNL